MKNPTYPTYPTWLSQNLDSGDRPDTTPIWILRARPDLGFKLGSFGFIKYIIGLNPNLNPIWDQPNPFGPVFYPEGQFDPTQPKFWVQNWVQHAKNHHYVVIITNPSHTSWFKLKMILNWKYFLR